MRRLRGALALGALALAVGCAAAASTARLEQCAELRKSDKVVQGCVVKGADGFSFVEDRAGDGCVASGTFIDSAFTPSNFGKLRVVTEPGATDLDQMFAAGFLEGYLTAARMYDHHYNLDNYFRIMLNESESLEQALNWLEGQEAIANQQIADAPPEDPYWRLLALVQQQFNGLVAGYQAAARADEQQRRSQAQAQAQRPGGSRRAGARRLAGFGAAAGGSGSSSSDESDVRVAWLERRDIMFLNGNGDVYDIMDALEAGYGFGGRRPEGGRSVPRGVEVDDDAERMAIKLGMQGKCSALIKVTGDLGEMYIGHSTHDSFTAMTRIFKHYDLSSLADDAIAAKRVSFSSYPGELFSDDDWYLLSSGLVVVETTNHIYRSDVYAPLSQRDCVLSWQRIRIANWMAASGEEWVRVFGRHNSGTYNNQYMVVDTKRFVPHVELQAGLLWVLEQLPGLVQAADMTDELSRGYWPSYNVAYFPDIYAAAGYPDMIARLEDAGAKKYNFSVRLLQYQVAPRAAIFRRDQGAVGSLDALKRLMRYNDWEKDAYALGNPSGAVCARGDLAKGDSALAKGCYDSKVTTATLAARLESEVVAGPTAQGQPAFSWSDPRWAGLPHRGMPDKFDFEFERMAPRDLPTLGECAAAEAAAARERHGAVEAAVEEHEEEEHEEEEEEEEVAARVGGRWTGSARQRAGLRLRLGHEAEEEEGAEADRAGAAAATV